MASELAFVLINPYTIAKSRTGGVIARVLSRTDLRLVGARMFGPSVELATRYADYVRRADPETPRDCGLLADYITANYAPDPVTGRVRRVMLLLFEGESAVQKIWSATGSSTQPRVSGSTIRDTYGDYILNPDGSVRYFEPAILASPSLDRTRTTLRLWASYSLRDGGIIDQAADVPQGEGVEKTLVLLKPDNFRFPSLRPGSIIDVLSSSGLRIIGVKKFAMSLRQAEEFYAPVRAALGSRFADIGSPRAAAALTREFGFPVPESATRDLCARLGDSFARDQFERIVAFMTGRKPSECLEEEKAAPGREDCLAIVYQGVEAVKRIRGILGTTDPSKASPGSVRREFGTDIMVNAAHASDSTESAEREMEVLRMNEEGAIVHWVERYYGLLA